MNDATRIIEAPNAARTRAPIYLDPLPGGGIEANAFADAGFDKLSFTAALVDAFGVARVGKIEPHMAGGWTACVGPPIPLPLTDEEPTDPNAAARVTGTYRLEVPEGSIAVTRHADGTIAATAPRADFTRPRFARRLRDHFGAGAVSPPTADPHLAIWRAKINLTPEAERAQALDLYAEAKAAGVARRCLARREAPSGEVILLLYQHTDPPFALYAGGMAEGNLADECATFDAAWHAFAQLYAAAGEDAGTFAAGFDAAIAATLEAAPDSPGLAFIARLDVTEVGVDTFEAGWDAACALLRLGVERAAGPRPLNPDRAGGHYRGHPRAGAPVPA